MNQDLVDKIDKDNEDEDEGNRSIVLAPRDKFDSAIIGYENKRVVYSEEAIIQIYMKEDGMTLEEAIDFYEFNTKCAYMGKYNPIYKSENYEEELWN